MKKVSIILMMFVATITASAQNSVDNIIEKLIKSYHNVPMREMLDKDPLTGKVTRHNRQYYFSDVKEKKIAPLIAALGDTHNGYYIKEGGTDNNVHTYELHVADGDPDYRTIYILETEGKDARLHILYGKMTLSEMYTNFNYSVSKRYNIINKHTGAKLGNSFDYNIHASAYHKELPSGIGPNKIKINDSKVLDFKLVPTVVVDTRISDKVCENCFIVTEDLFALEDGSETTEGQWLIFRYLDKNNPNQHWKLIEKDGTVTIINIGTGRCVDLAGGDKKEGAAVFSYDINEDPQTNSNQKWLIEETK